MGATTCRGRVTSADATESPTGSCSGRSTLTSSRCLGENNLRGCDQRCRLLSLSRLKTKDETTGLTLLGGYLSELGNSALVITCSADQNCSWCDEIIPTPSKSRIMGLGCRFCRLGLPSKIHGQDSQDNCEHIPSTFFQTGIVDLVSHL
jgi:hypothetical protein